MPDVTRIRYYHDLPADFPDEKLWPGVGPNVLEFVQDWDAERGMYRTVIHTDDITDHHRIPLWLRLRYRNTKQPKDEA